MKNICFILTIVVLFSCKTKEGNAPIFAEEAVLIVNYELENMSLEEHAALGAAVAPNFVSDSIPGLLGKSFIGNLDRGVFGGVYYFSSKASIDNYLNSELWKGIVAHPNLVNFKTDIFKTFVGSAIAGGEHSSRKTSSNPKDVEGLSVLVVNFNSKPTAADISKSIQESASVFNSDTFPGFIGKTFISNVEENVFGGVYYFESRSAIDQYLATDFWNTFETSDGIEVFKKDSYGVAPISTISNGVPTL